MPRRGPTKCSPRVDNLKRFDHPNVLSILLFGSPFFEPSDPLQPSDYPLAVKWWRAKLEAYRSQGLVPFIDTIYSPDDDTAQAPPIALAGVQQPHPIARGLCDGGPLIGRPQVGESADG